MKPVRRAKSPPHAATSLTTLAEWIGFATKRLQAGKLCYANGLQTPRFEAEYLACHARALPLEQLERHLDQPMSAAAAARLQQMLEQRLDQRLPVAYITQEAFFAGRRYFVDPRVLIPRSLLENVFDDPDGFPALTPNLTVKRALDLGTGSGCLAVALAEAYPAARIDAVDASPEALAVARVNVTEFGLAARIELIVSDWFSNLAGRCYDLIVTNPPYVPAATLERLPAEYRHEPQVALWGGDDGLLYVERILRAAVDHLNPGGVVVCEVGDEVDPILRRKWRGFPGEWLTFHFGGSGVFVITRERLKEWLTKQYQHSPDQLRNRG